MSIKLAHDRGFLRLLRGRMLRTYKSVFWAEVKPSIGSYWLAFVGAKMKIIKLYTFYSSAKVKLMPCANYVSQKFVFQKSSISSLAFFVLSFSILAVNSG